VNVLATKGAFKAIVIHFAGNRDPSHLQLENTALFVPPKPNSKVKSESASTSLASWMLSNSKVTLDKSRFLDGRYFKDGHLLS
jgi:hypothetical protein